MTAYRCVLDGERHPVVVAHLLPGDLLTVESPGGTLTTEADPLGEYGWFAFHCDSPCPRTGRYLTELGLAKNTVPRKRRVVTLALRAIRKGGAAVLEYGQLQTYPERTELGAINFTLVKPCEPIVNNQPAESSTSKDPE
jgi:hypothetical protein